MRQVALAVTAALGAIGVAGPFERAGISADDPRFVAWATEVVELRRGPRNLADPARGDASFGAPSAALGKPGGASDSVSLGDGGSITLGFATPICDGAGTDFAVFEQGFAVGDRVYAELGFVEVSSNGTDFFRFRGTSLTQTTTQVGGFGTLDPTDIHHLAGQHVAFEGSRFDLASLRGIDPRLNVDRVTHVRVVDVVGSILPAYARYDGEGRIINDPWPTTFASGGFDLDAVGVIHTVPEPGAMLALAAAGAFLRRRRA